MKNVLLEINNKITKYQINLFEYVGRSGTLIHFLECLDSSSCASWFNALLVVPAIAIPYTFLSYDCNIEFDIDIFAILLTYLNIDSF